MAAFAIYDSDARTVKFYRVEYDIAEAQRKILEQNLPSALAERLTLGIDLGRESEVPPYPPFGNRGLGGF